MHPQPSTKRARHRRRSLHWRTHEAGCGRHFLDPRNLSEARAVAGDSGHAHHHGAACLPAGRSHNDVVVVANQDVLFRGGGGSFESHAAGALRGAEAAARNRDLRLARHPGCPIQTRYHGRRRKREDTPAIRNRRSRSSRNDGSYHLGMIILMVRFSTSGEKPSFSPATPKSSRPRTEEAGIALPPIHTAANPGQQ